MASSAARVAIRLVMLILAIMLLFYIARPLYWKISATVHDIRHHKQTVKQGISDIMMEAQKTVGWYHDESDPGTRTSRRLLAQAL